MLPRFLYDDVGSQLYEQITALEEYYPYRAELSILQHHADAIAAQLPPGGVVVELGCGSSSKTAVLLAAAVRRHGAAAVRFCGVDCSAEALRQTRRSLQKLVPELPQEQARGGEPWGALLLCWQAILPRCHPGSKWRAAAHGVPSLSSLTSSPGGARRG